MRTTVLAALLWALSTVLAAAQDQRPLVDAHIHYSHNGSLATLADVVRHYSEVDEDRLHGLPGQSLIRPLRLTTQEQADLVAFLDSLSSGFRLQDVGFRPGSSACSP